MPTLASAATGTLRRLADPDEAPPSMTGLLLAAVLLLIVVAAVFAATRAARRRRGYHELGQRQRYGLEAEHLVAQIGSAWAECDEAKLSQLVSPELIHQWTPQLASAAASDSLGLTVDRVEARFIARKLPRPDEDDRVVMRVRARCRLSR